MKLPVQPPVAPMLAALAQSMPEGEDWLFEPKWDGFRCMVFYDGVEMLLQSRDLKPLGRYFPELEAALREVMPPGLVLDGEIVIVTDGGLDFDALLMRIHPAASRVTRLAAESPSSFVAFDILAAEGESLIDVPLRERRKRLEKVLAGRRHPLYLTPATTDRDLGQQWFERFEGAGLDGVIAKRLDQAYRPDERVLVKIKHRRTADCVVGGFRWAKDQVGEAIGSLLLGLYDDEGVLHHVGHTSSFKRDQRRTLVQFLETHLDPSGEASFGHGRTPGAPSRWTQGKDLSWVSLRPELVCEVSFDHLQGDRFRHASTFVRWRHDKPARQCDYQQLSAPVPFELREIFKA